jgi:hypothetical protein
VAMPVEFDRLWILVDEQIASLFIPFKGKKCESKNAVFIGGFSDASCLSQF